LLCCLTSLYLTGSFIIENTTDYLYYNLFQPSYPEIRQISKIHYYYIQHNFNLYTHLMASHHIVNAHEVDFVWQEVRAKREIFGRINSLRALIDTITVPEIESLLIDPPFADKKKIIQNLNDLKFLSNDLEVLNQCIIGNLGDLDNCSLQVSNNADLDIMKRRFKSINRTLRLKQHISLIDYSDYSFMENSSFEKKNIESPFFLRKLCPFCPKFHQLY
jgi:hypothetical protein